MNSSDLLKKLLKEKILIADGAMGTMIQTFAPPASDYGGAKHEGCNELLSVTRPDLIGKIHCDYLEAGADIIETNTFGSNPIVLSEYGLKERTRELNLTAAGLAARCAKKYSTASKPRFVAGSIGPTTKSLFVTGGISFDELCSAYLEQALALIEGGADILLLETAHDILNVKAGLRAVEKAFLNSGKRLPVMVSVTMDQRGLMLSGQNTEAVHVSLEHCGLLSLGFNCGTGPDQMREQLRTLSSLSRREVSCMPNAGLPDENGRYLESPEDFSGKMKGFASEGWLNIAGGCCGTTPAHIKLLAEAVKGKKPGKPAKKTRWAVSGIEPLFYDEAEPPILAGERTNSVGSKAFRELIAGGKWDEAVEVGKDQVKNGAQILDVCLANPERDEKSDALSFISKLARAVRIPLMIDTTDLSVAEELFKLCPGKCILNSINLEEGELKPEKAARLVWEYGAVLVVGCIDENKEQGMALTRKRKLEIASRAHRLLNVKFGVPEENIVFDALVFPCVSGNKTVNAARETVEALKLLKKKFPRVKTLLGVSNVSFGLPAIARETLNAVFLHHCVKAGLDIAIINPGKLARYSSLGKKEITLAEKVLFKTDSSAVSEFTGLFKTASTSGLTPVKAGTPVEKLHTAVLEGTREGVPEAIAALLNEQSAVEIIKGPLSKGMEEVGKIFSRGDMIVTEVLQSAEVMRFAMEILAPHLKKSGPAAKGKFLIATVKGDVHDIGKNLVGMILQSNGFNVLDLGIRVPAETIVRAVRDENPDFIGLSGLLVKSTEEMVHAAKALAAAGIKTPLVLGGAALTPRFVAVKIAPVYGGPVFYAKDAMRALETAVKLSNPVEKSDIIAENLKNQGSLTK